MPGPIPGSDSSITRTAPGFEVHPGQRIDSSAHGLGVVESLEEALRRDRNRPAGPPGDPKARHGRSGVWQVPSRRTRSYPASGSKNVVNRWGDPAMGIGFRGTVDLSGAMVGGVSASGSWARGLRAIGFFGGVEVARTGWFTDLDDEPSWFEIDLAGIDRVVFEARPAIGEAGWFSIDDLTFGRRAIETGLSGASVVLDFEDLDFRAELSGTGYAGLDWEVGRGLDSGGVHAPERPTPRGPAEADTGSGGSGPRAPLAGTAPTLMVDFEGVRKGQHSSSSYPPDTCGAVGDTQFVEVVNRVFAVFDKVSGQKLVGMHLGSFLPGSSGDPRVVFDHESGRWIVMVTDFSSRIYLAVSRTPDATGNWFKTNFVISQGSDAGTWPDYPTLGVDSKGIYVAAYMVGGSSMSIFAVDKAPLVASSPSLGTVTAFRGLPWEGAIQPCQTYGNHDVEYLVSVNGTSRIRVRRLTGSMSSPTLVTLGYVNVGTHSNPPNAPALGSSTALDTIGDRLMNAVYRDGSIWTAHTVSSSGRAACRWYELDASGPSLVQKGTVTETGMHYFFPGICVNGAGDVAMGFTGSNSSQYAACYYTGRLATDPAGEMAPPVQYIAGVGPQNNIDSYGRNRWGDYSLTTLDPDDSSLWTIQEYGQSGNQWATRIAELEFNPVVCNDPVNFCTTSPNSVGPGATMTWSGTPSLSAADLELVAVGCPPAQFGIFYYGASEISIPFGEGIRCVGSGGFGTYRFPPFQTDLFGGAFMRIDYTVPPAGSGPGAFFFGDTWKFQFWYRDPTGGPAQFNLSDGLSVEFCL